MYRCARSSRAVLFLVAVCAALGSARAADITSPATFIGHPVAADYQLARWEKIAAYFRQLDQ